MKRRTLKFIACAAIMAMTLSVTACGGSDDAAPATETEAPAEDETEAPADDAADTETPADDAAEAEAEPEEDTTEPEAEAEDEGADTAAAGDVTVESLLDDPAVKAQYEEAFAEYEEQGMTVSVSAKGNELSMSLTFQDASQATDEAAAQLQAALDNDTMASAFKVLAGSLDEAVGGETGTCTYSVSYLDPDGKVLAEKSYKAE